MMSTDAPTGTPAPDPTPRASRIVGRARLARNLLARLPRGQSLLLYGGPKLGKTSLLEHLRECLNRERPGSAAYLDLARVQDVEAVASTTGGACYLLVDHADHLLAEPSFRTIALLQGRGFKAIVWTGRRAWRDFAASAPELRLHPVPLAVLLPSQAHELVSPGLTANQIEWALSNGGTHPYVLETLRSVLLQAGPKVVDDRELFRAAIERLAPCFDACLRELRHPNEARLLDYLVRIGAPVGPAYAAQALGLPTVKRDGDVLCHLGLISRWNLNEGAKLQAGCPVFNAWYLGHVAGTPAVT